MKKYRPRWHDDEVNALSDLAVDFFEREVVAHVERWDAQRRIESALTPRRIRLKRLDGDVK